VLIVDDYRKDGEQHRYEWLMQTQGDVKMVRVEANADGTVDLVLGDGTRRRLLLRVLAAGDDARVPSALAEKARLEPYQFEYRNNVKTYQRVVLPLTAVNGHYKVLLYPYRDGEPRPTSVFEAGRLSLRIGEQQDLVEFSKRKDGRT